MKKYYILILILLTIGLLVGCTRVGTSKEDHEQLSQRLLELDLEQKNYYQVNIEVTKSTGFDRYFYMYTFNDETQTYHSTYRVNETEYNYEYSNGFITIKISSNNEIIKEETIELSFEEFKEKYVSLFGSKYSVDLMEASYKREKTIFSLSNNSYLTNYFTFNGEYEFSISLFELDIIVTDIIVEFGSIKNESTTTFFDNFVIQGKNNDNNKIVINISQ